MSALRRFVFPLALIVAAGSSAVGVWQARATHRIEATQAAIGARRLDLERRLAAGLLQLKQDSTSAVLPELTDGASPSASGLTVAAGARPPETMSGPDAFDATSDRIVIVETREELAYSVVEMGPGQSPPREEPALQRVKLELQYGGFLETLALSPEQKTRFLDVFQRQEEEEADLTQVAEAGKLSPNDSTIVNMHEEIAARNWAAVRALLGEEKAEATRQYMELSYSRDTVAGWTGGAAVVGISFDFPQLMQLAQAVHAARTDNGLGEIEWKSVAAAARTLLNSEQFVFVEPQIRHRALQQKSSGLMQLVEKTLDAAPPKSPAP